ncbi:Rrf2 family transcriptional regulator [Lactobacillus sp. LL6]|uniref:Rrf2 family transcriptional regulator n=1 Tax=Lactobacillus sp. LL6 TaxID=2596827 RepID=UPI0011856BF2|nr:Rrf2 family transcriptional regulator [Lactobacillus sp. LL6]TSO25438.1 Rrf2 family transcriptional regulator [Lactobacillus sp. LL6]
MKVNKSVEQATYVLLMLALQQNHTPLKSRILSEKLQVSDSYLKKILMKMKNKGLITAISSKNGGYQLARPIDEISLKDVFFALDLNKDPYDFNHLSYHVFPDKKHVKESEDKLYSVIDKAFDKFYAELDNFKLSDLLIDGNYQNGILDWNLK